MRTRFGARLSLRAVVGAVILSSLTLLPWLPEAGASSTVAWYSTNIGGKLPTALALDCVTGGHTCAAIVTGTSSAAAYSADSGGTWHNASIPSPAGWFPTSAGLSCVAVTGGGLDCSAIVQFQKVNCCLIQVQSYYSRNGGASWTRTTFPTRQQPGATVDRCFAVGAEADCVGISGGTGNDQTHFSHDGGATWTTSSGLEVGTALSCAPLTGALQCAEVGETGVKDAGGMDQSTAFYSTDGGADWTGSSLPSLGGWLTSVSCVPAVDHVDCAALGAKDNGPTTVGAYSTDGGQTWQSSTVPQGFGTGTISCWATQSEVGCAASLPRANARGTGVGGGLLFTSDGATWTAENDPSNQFGGVICLPSTTNEFCYGVGYSSRDGGQSWAASLVNRSFLPSDTTEGAFTFVPVACTSVGVCGGSTATTGLVSTTPTPVCSGTLPSGTVVGMATTTDGKGYWIASSTGAVVACGDAESLGHGPAGTAAIAAAPHGNGYWLATSGGSVTAYGSAVNYGGVPAGVHLSKPIVGMAGDPATGGYWLLGGDGGVFSFHAPFYGSTGNIRLNKPAVGMVATRDGRGYYFVASDGGIFTYGKDAIFYGSTGSMHLNKPIVGMALDPATGGYWMDAADGGIFSFHAPFYGSTGNIVLAQPCVGMSSMPNGSGYRFVAADGGIFSFHAPFEGSAV